MTYITELHGSTERLYFQEHEIGTDLTQQWKLGIKGSWPARYLVSGNLIYGAAGSKKGVAAWSFDSADSVWCRDDILFETALDFSVFDNLLHCYYDQGDGRDPYWINAITGEDVDLPFQEYGPPLGSIDGNMLISTDQGLTIVCPRELGSKGIIPNTGYTWGLVHAVENSLIALTMIDGQEMAIARINIETGDYEWVNKGVRAIPMYIDDKYVVISSYGESPGLWNAVIDIHSGEEIWRLPPRLPFTGANNPIFIDAEKDMLIAISVPYYDCTDGIFCCRLSTGDPLWSHSWKRSSGSGSLFVTGRLVWLVEPVDEKKRDLVVRSIETGDEISRKRIPGASVRIEWIEGSRVLMRSGKSLYCYTSD